MDGATQEVAVADLNGHVIAGPWVVPEAELKQRVLALTTAYPGAMVLIAGRPVNLQPAPPLTHVETASCDVRCNDDIQFA